MKQLIALVTLLMSSVAFAQEHFSKDWFWGNPEQRQTQDAMVGKDMPNLELSGWMNGQVGDEEMKGKILVLDFWATWCGPCIAAIPKNNQLAEKYRDQGVLVIGVCTAQGQEKMAQVVNEHEVAYPSAKDPGNVSAKAWNVMWYPTYALVDRHGKVRAVGLQTQFVEQAVQKLLEEQPAEGEAETAAAKEAPREAPSQ